MTSIIERNKVDKIPDIHDWEILGVNVNRFTHVAEICLHYPDKKNDALLRLYDVQKFFLSKMMLQNVILDVLLFETSDNSDYFTHCCQLLRIKPSEFDKNDKQNILYLEPSVGAELACSFARLEFLDIAH